MQHREFEEEITQLLHETRTGDPAVAEKLYGLIYSHMKFLARAQLRKVGPQGHLDTTALVHEVFLKLDKGLAFNAENRKHFFSIVSVAARHILIDEVRRSRRRAEVQYVTGESVGVEGDKLDLLAIDAALSQLESERPEHAKVFQCKYFGGLNDVQTSEALDISTRSVQRKWKEAREWLYKALS